MRIDQPGSPAQIVVSSQATAREWFAAQELQKYIRKISGVQLDICDDLHNPEGNQIIIGGPARNLTARRWIGEAEFARKVPGPEGFLIKSFADSAIVLAGSEGACDRGTVYAVYEFLERFLGCSLAAYSHPEVDAGEWVPHCEKIELGQIHYCKEGADRPFRGACVQYGSWAGNCDRKLNLSFFDWLAKNRYNYFYTWTSVYEQMKKSGLAEEVARRGIEFVVGHHDALDLFLPADGNEYFPEQYYQTQPEYFRLQADGTRYRPSDSGGQMIFCNRNESLIGQISENICSWLSDNPEVTMLQLAPHDGEAEQCVCEDCKGHTKAENYAYFLNEIAQRVSRVHPQVKIVMLIYADLWECPENLTLSSSLIAMESTWAAGGHKGLRTAGKPDGSCLNGTSYEENLLRWKATGTEAMYYDYYMGVYVMRQRYFPIADEIQAIWKRFIQKGILGASTQIECFNLWNHIFNFYTLGRTGYDTSFSMENYLERFARIFGNGAEWMKKAIRHAEACMDGQFSMPFCPEYLFSHMDIGLMHECFQKALSNAQTPAARNSVRMFRMVFRYTELEQKEKNANAVDQPVVRKYPNINPELLYMTKYDSYWKNDPGYGITVALSCEDGAEIAPYEPDEWYQFE